MVNSPQQGRPALKWGLIFGGALALISIISSTIQYMTGSFSQLSDPAVAQARLGTNLLLGCGSFILEAAIYFFAGMLTARENGKVGSGALAGLLAAAVGTVVGGAITIVTFLNFSVAPPAGSGIDPAQYASIMQTVILISAVGGVVIGLGIGTGIAALGGLVGRGQYESAHPLSAMEGSMYMPTSPAGAQYPYAPPPGYPAPGAPGIYPPPTGSSAGESSQYPPAPGVYPPPPGTPQPPQQPQ